MALWKRWRKNHFQFGFSGGKLGFAIFGLFFQFRFPTFISDSELVFLRMGEGSGLVICAVVITDTQKTDLAC